MKQVPSQFEQDIAQLAMHPAFARILLAIKENRESYIAAMHDIAAGANGIMQVSGRILAYDDVLRMCDAEKVIARHRDAPVG